MARILVVDDSGMSRRTLRKILESAGHHVSEAADGIAALEQYFVDRPDLVLLDLTMAGMYGIEVLNRLREMDSQARVIIASADIQSSTKTLVEEVGASAYINKPFVIENVLEVVNRVLQGGAGGAD